MNPLYVVPQSESVACGNENLGAGVSGVDDEVEDDEEEDEDEDEATLIPCKGACVCGL